MMLLRNMADLLELFHAAVKFYGVMVDELGAVRA